MAQFPPVKLKVHPSTFDLMMTILEHNTAAEDVQTRNNAQDLMEKRMRFTRLYPGRDGKPCASIQMYESEAAEMIWLSTPFQNVDFRRNGMSFFTGQHTGVIQPYTPHHLPV